MRRLVRHLVGAVLDCFRPVIDFVLPPRHPELHTAAVTALSQTTSVLQHYALHFLAEVTFTTQLILLGRPCISPPFPAL